VEAAPAINQKGLYVYAYIIFGPPTLISFEALAARNFPNKAHSLTKPAKKLSTEIIGAAEKVDKSTSLLIKPDSQVEIHTRLAAVSSFPGNYHLPEQTFSISGRS